MKNSRGFRYIFISMISIGALVTIGQVLVLREFLVIFYGNELSIGIILAIWLLWGGLGSIAAGKVCIKRVPKTSFFEFTALVLSLLLPITILAIRYSRILWGIIPGEIIDPLRMLQIASFLLFPFCVTSGILFVLANHFAKSIFPRTPISTLYMAEAMGAGAGGIVFHFFLLPHLLVLSIASITAIQLTMVSFLFFVKTKKTHRPLRPFLYSIILLVLAIALIRPSQVDMLTRKWEWPKSRILASDDSIYNNIIVTKEKKQISFFTNGLWYFSTNDEQSAEEAVHLAMLENARPEKVLILGSTLSGVAKEVLKHPSVKHLEMVELDPDILALARKYLPHTYLEPLDDPRVKFYLADARNFLIKRKPGYFDVIIMIQPDPLNALISRFYTVEFFTRVKKVLTDNGVFAFRLTGAENMLGQEMATYLASLFWTARKVFPDVLVIPGENTRFFCSPHKGILASDTSILQKRLISRHLRLRYIRSDSLMVMFNPFKIGYVASLFDDLKKKTTLNYDFRPRCYFDDIVVWSRQYSKRLVVSLKSISTMNRGVLFSATALIMLLLFYIVPALLDRNREKTAAIYFSTAVVGFSHITIEIVLILSFQIFYGFLYRQLGLLVGAFMAGLALGTFSGEQFFRQNPQTRINLSFVQFLLLAVISIISCSLLLFHQYVAFLKNIPDWFLFPSLAFTTGVVGGLQFPMASNALDSKKVDVEKAAGNLYGYDLAGSALGCIVTSIVLLPLLGIPRTLLFLAILSVITIVILFCNPSTSIQDG